MPDESFVQLANDAAAGLKADRELFLDVTRELTSHMEDTAEHLCNTGHSPEESIELAKKSFGSPLEVATELLDANRQRMKFRARCRLAFAAILMPLAITLALVLGYGRLASLQTAVRSLGISDSPLINTQLPALPFLGSNPDNVTTQDITLRQLQYHEPTEIFHYWESHRSEPNSKIYYAYYALFLEPADEQSYVAAMRQGEKIEPGNALYNLLLTQYYLSNGMSAKSEQTKKPGKELTDELRDRRTFELGIKELHTAVNKPYYRTYQTQVVNQKLHSLSVSTPTFTEGCLQRLSVAAKEPLPQLIWNRELAQKISGCARLLLTEHRRSDAEAVMDSWRPYTTLLAQDSISVLLSQLGSLAAGDILTKEGYDIYLQLGLPAKAQEVLAINKRLAAWKVSRESSANASKITIHEMLRKHGALIDNILIPTSNSTTPLFSELTPTRMHEHVLFEELFTGLLCTIYILAMLWALLQGAIWLHRLRGSSSVPLLLLPPARVMLRALVLGIALPMVIYWVYSRLPVIGGREYGWLYMFQRFAMELLLLGGIVLWLPGHMMRRYIRQRCDELAIAIPGKRDEVTNNRRVRMATIFGIGILILASYTSFNSSPLISVVEITLGVGLLVIAWYFTTNMRQNFGLYYGTLARSIAPLYALAVIFLSLTVQPWLLYQEAKWLQHDTLCMGFMAKTREDTAISLTSVEAQSSQRLHHVILQALEEK
ncbi:MAG TPA: permease prefix domain 1-containing protein [Armatimonadota bacterium]|nr:permease prefix domain 1-containing protein [Armatimonadota bacterium]